MATDRVRDFVKRVVRQYISVVRSGCRHGGQFATLVFVESAPDTELFRGSERILQALSSYRALRTDLFRGCFTPVASIRRLAWSRGEEQC